MPETIEQPEVMKAIYYYIKKGDLKTGGQILHRIAETLIDQGAKAMICGCTEVSLSPERWRPSDSYIGSASSVGGRSGALRIGRLNLSNKRHLKPIYNRSKAIAKLLKWS